MAYVFYPAVQRFHHSQHREAAGADEAGGEDRGDDEEDDVEHGGVGEG